jgi:hypothetical protein
MNLPQKHIVLCLILICAISLSFKLYLVDFSVPVNSDNLAYALNAIAHSNGDFTQPPHRGIGWSIFLSTFFSFVDSDNFLDYSNLSRIVSISVATSSIFLIYGVARKFFDERYSLVTSCLFAFLPHLNHNSIMGLSEPIFILTILASFYFILNNKLKFVTISFILVGFAYWIRLNGLIIFIVISLVYLLTFKKSQNFLRNYGIGVIFFILVLSPMLIQKYEQYGDPFYSSYQGSMFSENYEQLESNLLSNTKSSAFDYIQNHGIAAFFDNFLLGGFVNSLNILFQLSIPYLFILLPFGVLFSLRAFDQKSQYIKANWIFIISSILLMSVIISIVPEKRFLFFLMPFLVIFSVIPIQRVTEYGLNTFSFSRKQKDIFLIIVLIIVIILSGLFTLRYEKPDHTLENEKFDFSQYALQNLDGNALRDYGGSTDYTTDVVLVHDNNFRDFKIDYWIDKTERKKYEFREIGVYGESIEDLILNGEGSDLKYLISNNKKTFYYSFVDDVYHNEKNFPYLIKVFDSEEYGYQKLKIKVFEIDYEKFHELDSDENE